MLQAINMQPFTNKVMLREPVVANRKGTQASVWNKAHVPESAAIADSFYACVVKLIQFFDPKSDLKGWWISQREKPV